MLATRYIPHSVYLGGSTSWINQIEDTAPDHGIELYVNSSGSGISPEFVALKQAKPELPLTTSDLTLISTIGLNGLAIAAASGFVMYGRAVANEAAPTAIATSAHLKCTVTDGLLVPLSIRASNNQIAKFGMKLHALLGSNGNTVPFTWAASSTITSGAGNIVNQYTNGPVKYTISGGASRLVQGIEDSALDFGIDVKKEYTDGEFYPAYASIFGVAPTFEFQTADVELITEIGDGVSVSAFAGYFRNIIDGAQRAAPSATSHFSASSTAGMIRPTSAKLTHERPGMATFLFTPQINTTIMTFSSTATIPTS